MSLVILGLMFFLPLSGVRAHKLNIFAYYEGGKINIESFFSDGTPCRSCRFSIVDEEGNVLKDGILDSKGQATVPISLRKGVYVKVNASMGHMATFHINPPSKDLSNPPLKKENKSRVSVRLTEEELRRIVGEELQKQLRPIIMELARLEKDKLPKIVAALGYILGVFGILAILKSRSGS